MGTKKKGASEGDTLKSLAATTAANVATVDPGEQAVRAQNQATLDWASGKSGPVDVHNMPGSGLDIGLYENARRINDAGRIGGGSGALEGVNPNYNAALDKEQGFMRDTNAAGMLEGEVQNRVAAANPMALSLADRASARTMNMATLAQQRLENYQRYKQPSFLKQLVLGSIGAIGQAAGAGAKFGI